MDDTNRMSLDDRMKRQYENITRIFLPRRTYTIVRLDGKAFHSYTSRFDRPYDTHFMNVMDHTAQALCDEIQGSRFAYTQSDEISILLTDFEKPDTSAWFDGNLQKIVSVSASCATAWFNHLISHEQAKGLALFDSRAFIIPDYVEVENYFISRQKDAERNSIQMLAQHHASHKQLFGKSLPYQMDIIHDAGDNWDKHPVRFKRGGCVNREGVFPEIPIFTKDREFLQRMIPRHWQEDLVASQKS